MRIDARDLPFQVEVDDVIGMQVAQTLHNIQSNLLASAAQISRPLSSLDGLVAWYE